MISSLIAKIIPYFPKVFVYIFAKKYIAGPTLDDAVRVTKNLMSQNGMSTIDVLGEFVSDKVAAEHELEMCFKVLDTVKENNLKTYLSIKPTSVGLGIDFDYGYNNIKSLVSKAKEYGLRARLDMENSPYTDMTLDAYRRLRSEGFDNVGLVLQAYMKRSEADVRSLIDLKPNVRLCKGIYNEAPEIAIKDRQGIRDNFKKLFRLMLDNEFYVGIATHDEELIQDALAELKKRNLQKDEYEFQMLLGVREERRSSLLKAGHNLRVYVPFGDDWFGYATRRLKENPQMVSHIIKSILGINK
jgi:proline dehydrogenase